MIAEAAVATISAVRAAAYRIPNGTITPALARMGHGLEFKVADALYHVSGEPLT